MKIMNTQEYILLIFAVSFWVSNLIKLLNTSPTKTYNFILIFLYIFFDYYFYFE